MENGNFALKVNGNDNVATVFANGVAAGSCVRVMDKKGEAEDIVVRSSVPYGHKIALCELRQGDLIVKYGETIGVASRDIHKGEYVHVHNLDALRGRGDLRRDAV